MFGDYAAGAATSSCAGSSTLGERHTRAVRSSTTAAITQTASVANPVSPATYATVVPPVATTAVEPSLEDGVHGVVGDRDRPDGLGAVPDPGVEDPARGDHGDGHRRGNPAGTLGVVRRRQQDQRQVEQAVHEPGQDSGPPLAGELLHPRQQVSAPPDLLPEDEDGADHCREDQVDRPGGRRVGEVDVQSSNAQRNRGAVRPCAQHERQRDRGRPGLQPGSARARSPATASCASLAA